MPPAGRPRARRPHLVPLVRLARAAGLAAALLGAAGPAEGQRLQFRQLTPDDGLSASWVPDMLQDRRGFVWFGTAKGLSRYDGYGFTTYRRQRGDSTGLVENYVIDLHEDREGTVWIGTRGGMARYDADRDAVVRVVLDAAQPRQDVAAFVEDSQGGFWVGAATGLYRFDRARGVGTRFAGAARAGIAGRLVQVLHEDRRQRIWIGTAGAGLRELDPATGKVRTWKHDPADPRSLPDDDVRALAEDADGRIWIGTYNGGLARLDPAAGTLVRYQHDPADPRSLALNRILRVVADPARGIWVGTENGGLDLLDPATGIFRHHRADPNDPGGLSNNSIWSLLLDRSGTLWVGTFAGGVHIAKQNGDAIRRYRVVAGDPRSLSSNAVSRFAEDAQGGIWVGTDGGGLNRLDPATGRFVRYSMRASRLPSDAVLGVASARDGAIWIASWAGGIARLDRERGTIRALSAKAGELPEDNFFSVHEDRDGRMWGGSWRTGLILVDHERGTFRTYPIAPRGVAESVVRLIRDAADGRLLIGTDGGGLVVFDPRTGARVNYVRSDTASLSTLSANAVQAIHESEPGVLWIGTPEGLDRLELRTRKVEHLTEADGLPSANVVGIAPDGAGHLWISTERGITRFDPRKRTFKHYSVADGLQGSEFNPAAYFRARDGTLYFGGGQGFNAIRPERIAENPHRPAVALTGFQLFNRPVAIGGDDSPLERHISRTSRLVLSHRQSVFTLEFAALDYTAPEQNRYAYMLEGFDEAWNEVGRARTASYTNLPAGRYTFRVKGSNNDGVWNEEGASLEIVVRPPFWRTWWFRSLLFLAVAAAVAAVVRAAVRRRRGLEAMNAQLAAAAERDRASQQYLERHVMEILVAMDRFSEGDLSVALEATSDDAIGRLRGGVTRAVANIRFMVAQVREVLGATVRASRAIRAQAEELARGAEEQIQQAVEVAGAAEEMSVSVEDSVQHMTSVAELAQRSGDDAQTGGRVVRETFGRMDAIATSVGGAAATVEALGRSSREIGDITRVIAEIADQTNLLALNTAIEAARAGKHGKTFSVLAGEVRDLATRTANSTQQIARVIHQNQRDVAAAIATMEQVTGQVASGRELVDQASAALEAIVSSSERVLESVQQVTASTEEQAATTAHISENIETISGVTRTAVEGNQQIARAVQTLDALIADLQARVARFQLGEGEAGVAAADVPSLARPEEQRATTA